MVNSNAVAVVEQALFFFSPIRIKLDKGGFSLTTLRNFKCIFAT